MVYLHRSISVCNSVDQASPMGNSGNSSDFMMNPKPSKPSSSRANFFKKQKVSNPPSCLKIPSCERSRSAAIDVVILIAVIAAFGFLLFPTIKSISLKLFEFIEVVFYLVKDEMMISPMVYGSIGLGFSCSAIAASILLLCTTRKCGKPHCKGLSKATEFDIQLETEECVKNSSSTPKDGVTRGLLELLHNRHKELEAELKRMAPVNGRAVLIFRAKCGCSVGRLEVPGPKKKRKIKK
ncbi:hypothetical protein F3Y22_tig00111409pilonHSYRG00118 [Hibiscus syriacus]|uniref:Dof zinc finger protein DOF5.2 n=1 Tax=Hibiscus syriacus TaxID=106335 RepID=A0A6A2YKB1_HIBSY|nr:uncharacterized protein At5g19025-like [Hibiscus syriacus]KAE8678447.1 hypothetical protein F3Y22_tig00111409pilonHSYRG00118 [Hibiscus syriacus]